MVNSYSDLQAAYKSFFSDLVSTMKMDYHFSTNRKIDGKNYHNFPLGSSGIRYACGFHPSEGLVESALYLSRKHDAKEIFDLLFNERTSIEKDFGENLIWGRQDDQVRCRIAIERPGHIIMDASTDQVETKQWMIENLQKFREVFAPRIKRIL